MRDIYHALISRDFSQTSDEALKEDRDAYADAAMAINFAMRAMGILIQEVELRGEEYSDQDARRDLFLIGSALRHFPRMVQALEQNKRTAAFELKKREGGDI